jgi:hypothetical protein
MNQFIDDLIAAGRGCCRPNDTGDFATAGDRVDGDNLSTSVKRKRPNTAETNNAESQDTDGGVDAGPRAVNDAQPNVWNDTKYCLARIFGAFDIVYVVAICNREIWFLLIPGSVVRKRMSSLPGLL